MRLKTKDPLNTCPAICFLLSKIPPHGRKSSWTIWLCCYYENKKCKWLSPVCLFLVLWLPTTDQFYRMSYK